MKGVTLGAHRVLELGFAAPVSLWAHKVATLSSEEAQSTATDLCDMQKSSHRRDLEILGAVFSDRRMEVRS